MPRSLNPIPVRMPPLTGQGSVQGPSAFAGLAGVTGSGNASAAGNTSPSARRVKSDPRFRSYAERYTAARCHLFRTSPEGHAADQWECVQDAKRIYNMIRSVGENIDPEDLDQ